MEGWCWPYTEPCGYVKVLSLSLSLSLSLARALSLPLYRSLSIALLLSVTCNAFARPVKVYQRLWEALGGEVDLVGKFWPQVLLGTQPRV